jgi:glycosyltransferase involved in cell wall biosynthesis
MKILLPLPYTPYPVRKGTDRLMLNLIEGLSARHEVILATMTLSRGEDELLTEIARTNVTVRSILAPNRRSAFTRVAYKIRNMFLGACSGVPKDVLYAAPDSFLNMIAEIANREDVDLVLPSYWHLYRLPGLLPGMRAALITHDIDFSVHGERLRYAGEGAHRTSLSADVKRKERIEREAYRRYPAIITLTGRDREILQSDPEFKNKPVTTLPLAMNLEEFRSGEGERDRDRILFLGYLDSDFNKDALGWFVGDVFPAVRRDRPEAVLEIVGHGGDDALRQRLDRPGVMLSGGVADIRPHLRSCSLLILPLRFGGGVRIRMMEAAAMGVPVVSTPAGIAGFHLANGEEYLEALDAAAMAEAILKILGDRKLAAAISRNVRSWAEEHISMNNYPERLDQFLDDLNDIFSKSGDL